MRRIRMYGLALASLLVAANTANAQPIGAETYSCQRAITKAVAKFESKIASAIEGCLLAVQKCNTEVGGAETSACIAKLLVLNEGKCAIGKLGPTDTYFGPGSSTSAVDGSAIGKAYGIFIKQLAKCDPTIPIDFSTLNLSNPTPTSVNDVAEALNTNPDGVACLAHKRVLRTIPARDALLDQLALHPDGANVPGTVIAILFSGNTCK